MKKDIIATKQARFSCRYSYVRLDGGLRLRGKDWKVMRAAVLIRDGFTCQQCGQPFDLAYETPEVHHIRKRSKGGDDSLGNLTTLHHRCHELKHPEKQTRFSNHGT